MSPTFYTAKGAKPSRTALTRFIGCEAYYFYLVPKKQKAAWFLAKCVFWSRTKTAQERGGWFYKSAEQWQQELPLSEGDVYCCGKLLEALGFIEMEKRQIKGAPTLCYRLNEAVFQAAEAALLGPDDEPQEALPRRGYRQQEPEEPLVKQPQTQDAEETRVVTHDQAIPENQESIPESRESWIPENWESLSAAEDQEKTPTARDAKNREDFSLTRQEENRPIRGNGLEGPPKPVPVDDPRYDTLTEWHADLVLYSAFTDTPPEQQHRLWEVAEARLRSWERPTWLSPSAGQLKVELLRLLHEYGGLPYVRSLVQA